MVSEPGEEVAGAQAPDDLDLLIQVLPERLREKVRALPGAELLEVVLDLGRAPKALLAASVYRLEEAPVTRADLEWVLERVGAPGDDNRAGIERTLHRISAIRNRQGKVVGLTLRVGRAIFGVIELMRDLVESGLNLLLLGRPGVGKTTKLREVTRVLADDLGKRVMVVDTSNEIGGDGDVPHPGIGSARRMQVSRTDRQHAVMIEAVENHMPEAIIIDEIGTEAEAAAARTIAERGVQLVGTAHGNTLENLVLNPTLSDLVGGVQTVTLGDEEARRRRTQKTVSERRAPPTFDIVVEMINRDEVVVHRDTARAVDSLLAGRGVGGERRVQGEGGVRRESVAPVATAPLAPPRPSPQEALREGRVKLHAHAVSRDLLQRAMRELHLEGRIVERPEVADLILTLRSREGDNRVRRAAERGVMVYTVKRNSVAELRRVLRNALLRVEGLDEGLVREAIAEAEHAVQRVLAEEIAIPLAPRPPQVRKLQHKIILRFHLDATATGSEPMRHLVVFPEGAAASQMIGGLEGAAAYET